MKRDQAHFPAPSAEVPSKQQIRLGLCLAKDVLLKSDKCHLRESLGQGI
jgi:hypothetical protein